MWVPAGHPQYTRALSEAGRTLLARKEVTAKLKDERAQFVCQHEAHHESTGSRQFNNLSIMTELKYRPSVDESDKTVQELILHLDEQTQFAVHMHEMIKLVLSIDDDDLSPLSERRGPRTRRRRWRQSIEVREWNVHAQWKRRCRIGKS